MGICSLFQPSEPMKSQANLAINKVGSWYTWSADFRNTVRSIRPWLLKLPEPKLAKVQGLVEYDYTFTTKAQVPDALQPFIGALYGVKCSGKIMLFTRLIDRVIEGAVLSRIFALLRRGIADCLGDERYCLYAPLGATGANAGDFKLHADLYLPELLFNVFEDVPRDSSGASVFLKVADLRRIVGGIESMPDSVRRRIIDCLTTTARRDRFNEFFDLLHEPARRWVPELEAALAQKEYSLKLSSGQGYLIHDRTWLHGRTTANGGVSRRRVHRLIFNNRAKQHAIAGNSVGRVNVSAPFISKPNEPPRRR